MTIFDAIRTYRIPRETTPEELEMNWSKVLTFGNKVLLAGYYYNGVHKPCYFAAVYEFKGEDHTCENAITLLTASEVEFEDDGHAIEWALKQCNATQH